MNPTPTPDSPSPKPTDIAILRELLAKATPGPVDCYQRGMFQANIPFEIVGSFETDADATLHMALRNAAPALLDDLERLRDHRDFLQSKGLTVGTMKESGKEPRLAYVIERDSELCDLRAVRQAVRAEIKRDKVIAERDKLREEVETLKGVVECLDSERDSLRRENAELKVRFTT